MRKEGMEDWVYRNGVSQKYPLPNPHQMSAKRSHFEGLVNDKKGAKHALLSSINSGKCISFEDLLFELN